MNAIFSMIGCLLFGCVIGIFCGFFSEGTALFGGVSQIGWMIGCVSAVTIIGMGLKNNNYMFIQNMAIAVFALPISLGIFHEMSSASDTSALAVNFEKITPWVLIVYLAFLAVFVMLEDRGFFE